MDGLFLGNDTCESSKRSKNEEEGDCMGNVTSIAKSNEFWIKNLNEFKEGLKGYIGGEYESPPSYQYSDYKKKSKRALISLNSEDFSLDYYKENNEDELLDFLEYIKLHILEDETCVIHLVTYEHSGDMEIFKYSVTSKSIQEEIILGD